MLLYAGVCSREALKRQHHQSVTLIPSYDTDRGHDADQTARACTLQSVRGFTRKQLILLLKTDLITFSWAPSRHTIDH